MMDHADTPNPRKDVPDRERHAGQDQAHDDSTSDNPPRTTEHGVTAPKFGSAGSGGAELEPGPERD